MTTKATTKKAEKPRVGKPATKAKSEAVAPGRTSRSRRSAGAAMADTADTADATLQSPPRPASKKGMIEALVRREGGAVIAELMVATGWQEHSIRAALTGLRKAGHTISRDRDADGTTRYRVAGAV